MLLYWIQKRPILWKYENSTLDIFLLVVFPGRELPRICDYASLYKSFELFHKCCYWMEKLPFMDILQLSNDNHVIGVMWSHFQDKIYQEFASKTTLIKSNIRTWNQYQTKYDQNTKTFALRWMKIVSSVYHSITV